MEGYNHSQRSDFFFKGLLYATLAWYILKPKLDGWFSKKI